MLIRNPSLRNATILAVVILLGIGLVWMMKRYARKRIDNS
jgi:hypothetical protein